MAEILRDASLNKQQPVASASGISIRGVLAAVVAAVFGLGIISAVPLVLVEKDPKLVEGADLISQQNEVLKAMPASERQTLIDQQQALFLAEPLDRDALANLADLWRLQGNTERANALTSLAANRSLRSLRLQAAELELLLANKQYRDALFHLDALIRAQPESRDKFFTAISGMLADNTARDAVAEYLSESPSWRQQFLAAAATSVPDANLVYRLLATMRNNQTVVDADELRPLLQRLVRDQKYDTAYYQWLDFRTPDDLNKVDNVFDGGFDRPVDNLLFGWNFSASQAVEIHVGPRSTGATDQILQLTFAGGKLDGSAVTQMLRVSPGHYALSGDMRTDDLKSGSGLVWDLYCIGAQNAAPVVKSPAFNDTSQWSSFSVVFDIPAQNCETQILALEPGTRAELDKVFTGRAFFDNIAIRPADPDN